MDDTILRSNLHTKGVADIPNLTYIISRTIRAPDSQKLSLRKHIIMISLKISSPNLDVIYYRCGVLFKHRFRTVLVNLNSLAFRCTASITADK